METGPYLTDISIKEQETYQPKFLRCILSLPKTNLPSEKGSSLFKRNQTQHKNINNFLSDEYYMNKKVKPGLWLFKAILDLQEMRKNEPNAPSLEINLPYTMLLAENSQELIYSHNGTVKVKSLPNFNQYMKIVKKDISDVGDLEGVVFPAALVGVGNGTDISYTVLLSNEIDMRVVPKSESQISQKFIKPFGNTPNMLRLFYTPKSIKGAKPNYGYKGTNKKKIGDWIFEKKNKQSHHYLVDFSKTDDFVVTIVRGKALAEAEKMSQSIIDCLQYLKHIKISELICDFIKSQDNIYYLHQIKSIRSTNLPQPELTPQQVDQSYRQKINQISCHLCTYTYPKTQMTRRVTNKLIKQLYLHLRSRGQFGLNLSQNRRMSDLSGSSYVCSLCYELIVAENRLIQLEEQFSRLLNVRPREIIRIRDLEDSNDKDLGLSDAEGHLWQWRMFVYIQKIKNIPHHGQFVSNLTLNMKFNDLKQTFTKKFQKFGSSQSRAVCDIKQQKKRIPQSPQQKQIKKTLPTASTNRSQYLFQKQNAFDFQKVKILTFYTVTEDISNILLNEELFFDLSCPFDRNSMHSMTYMHHSRRYKGQSSTLQNFSNKKDCQRHSCEILLFGDQYEYCNLELSVGLICNGQVTTQDLILQKSTKNQVYYCQNASISNCAPLPPQWIQLVSQGLQIEREPPPDSTALIGQCEIDLMKMMVTNGFMKEKQKRMLKRKKLGNYRCVSQNFEEFNYIL